MKKYIIILFLIFSGNLVLKAQIKDEREERIKINELPRLAKQTLTYLPPALKRLKFYKETDGKRQSFEIKFKYKKEYYSIEFDTLGTIEDIEVICKIKQLESKVKNQILTYFDSTYEKTKIIKAQQQFVFSDSFTTKDFISKVLNKSLKTNINYEIIVEVTKASKRSIREFTFNRDGLFIDYRIVTQPNYSHVLFEN